MSDRLAKHVAACQTASKARPVYDVAMARITGTEAAELVNSGRSADRQTDRQTDRQNNQYQTLKVPCTVSVCIIPIYDIPSSLTLQQAHFVFKYFITVHHPKISGLNN